MDAMVTLANPVSADHKARAGEISGSTAPPDWFPSWAGETCLLIASGPTAKKANVAIAQGRAKVIAINESYQLAPWADALYACDGQWWQLRHGVQDFYGLKIGHDDDACKSYPAVKKVKIDRYSNEIQLSEHGRIGAGGNSGFQALNLAVQFGCTKIMLVGYDMRVDLGEHWHKRHPMPLSNPHPNDNIPRWIAALDGAAPKLRAAGIKVVNCSPVSMLKAYPKTTVEEALNAFEL